MRNPWSTEVYYGEGSDATDDGTFELPLANFKVAFPDFTINYYDDWKVTSIGGATLSSGASYNYEQYVVENPTQQDVIFTFDLPMAYQLSAAPGCELYDSNVEFWLTSGTGFFYSSTKLADTPIAARAKLTPSTSIVVPNLSAGSYKVSVLAANNIDIEYNVMAYAEN